MKLTMSSGCSIRDKKNNILNRSMSTSRQLSRSGITRTLNPALHSHHSESYQNSRVNVQARRSQPVQALPHNPLTKNCFKPGKAGAFKNLSLYESKVISLVPQYRYKPQKPVRTAPSMHTLLQQSQKKKRNDKIPTNLLAAEEAIQQQSFKRKVSMEVSRSMSQSQRIKSRVMKLN